MRFCSPLIITHDDIVLLALTDDLEGSSYRAEGAASVETVPLAGAAAPGRFPRGNEACALTFQRYRKYEEPLFAQKALLATGYAGDAEAYSRAVADCTIEIEGGSESAFTYLIPDAVVISWGAALTEDGLTVIQSFRVEGGPITIPAIA